MKTSILKLLLFFASTTFCLQNLSRDQSQLTSASDTQQIIHFVGQSVNQNNCVQNCAFCSLAQPKVCQQCMVGFVLQANGNCKSCSEGCAMCKGQQICSQCLTGYTKISEGYFMRCIPCSQNCLQCSYFQIQAGSITELTTCSKCASGFYLQSQSGSIIQTCAPCIQGCFTCLNSSSCSQCVSGFGYNQKLNLCQMCQQNCITCFPNGCQVCSVGYFLNIGTQITCQKCISNCLQCGGQYDCQKCSKGYYPYNSVDQETGLISSTCISCPNQCVLCYSQQICSTCQQGYFLNVTEQQEYDNATNQTIHVIKSATCQACTINCLACSDGIICSTCLTGYFVNSQGTCQICGIACHQCLNAGECISCLGSYYLKAGKCQSCGPLCSNCHLATVNQQQIPYCIDCVSFYYTLVNGQCVSCADFLVGCLTCSNSNSCLTCAEGYSLHSSNCLENKKLGVAYIVMLCIAGIIAFVAIVFGLWACWRHRNGYGFLVENSQNPGVRASYYQIP